MVSISRLLLLKSNSNSGARPHQRNLKLLIYIYAVLYGPFLIWTLIDARTSPDPRWEILSDVVLLTLGGIGILLFLLSVGSPFLKSLWRVVSIVIVVGQLASNVLSRHETRGGKTELNPEKISEGAKLAADLVTIVLLMPMIVLNFMYAFS